ncbi:hypothetical protein F511_18138 [Dorcoceras hygrometricum]|uniref:Uncharacterized protein n=1 Tax=Dorcoceras hygrometricum TaxID=472368 RepID=A0A2Z7A8T4_9LAMI|nr:hypothetical protein F511_18138 [Dorcoceras hygrometricum]
MTRATLELTNRCVVHQSNAIIEVVTARCERLPLSRDRSVLLGLRCSSCVCGNCSSEAGEILRASGNTTLSSPCWYLLDIMPRVVNYHSSWCGQQQVELLMHLVFRVWCKDERKTFHSFQLDYLKTCKGQHRPKQPKNRENKRGQTSVRRALIKQQFIKHSILQVMICMRVPKNNRQSRPTTQLQFKSQWSLNTTHSQSAGGNHRSVIFRCDNQPTITVQWYSGATAASHHLDVSIGPFSSRRNTTGTTPKLKSVKISHKSAHIKAHTAYSLMPCSLKQLPELYRALSISNSKLITRRNHLLKSSKGTEELLVNNREYIELFNYFLLPQLVDSGLHNGINRKILRRRAQRHQSCSIRRRKSSAIYGKRVRVNSKGFEALGKKIKNIGSRISLSVDRHWANRSYACRPDLDTQISLESEDNEPVYSNRSSQRL